MRQHRLHSPWPVWHAVCMGAESQKDGEEEAAKGGGAGSEGWPGAPAQAHPQGVHVGELPLRLTECRAGKLISPPAGRVHTPSPAYPAQTIENTREKDETMVQADDEEVAVDEEQDEFAGRWKLPGHRGMVGGSRQRALLPQPSLSSPAHLT
jgi:hypothetical protein